MRWPGRCAARRTEPECQMEAATLRLVRRDSASVSICPARFWKPIEPLTATRVRPWILPGPTAGWLAAQNVKHVSDGTSGHLPGIDRCIVGDRKPGSRPGRTRTDATNPATESLSGWARHRPKLVERFATIHGRRPSSKTNWNHGLRNTRLAPTVGFWFVTWLWTTTTGKNGEQGSYDECGHYIARSMAMTAR